MKAIEKKHHFLIFYMLGFLFGILFANLASKQLLLSSGVFSDYFLSQYVDTELIAEEFLLYILRIRIVPLFILLLLGTTKARKVVVAGFLMWTGFSSGMLMVSAIMQMGMKGIALCAVGITPHFLFYILAYVIVLLYLYLYPISRWNMGKSVVVFFSLSVGILMEAYVHPILLRFFLLRIGK